MTGPHGSSPRWDDYADTFDDDPDHGLRDPAVHAAWSAVLLPLMPGSPARVIDLGCGTGSLSVLLAHAGHLVLGIDSSERMLALAEAKATAVGCPATFQLGDASDPATDGRRFDVVLVRHVLWALADPAAVVGRWVRLLRPGGRLVLIEGRWSTGAGLTADDCRAVVSEHRDDVRITPLTDPALWGGPITDERYLLVSDS